MRASLRISLSAIATCAIVACAAPAVRFDRDSAPDGVSGDASADGSTADGNDIVAPDDSPMDATPGDDVVPDAGPGPDTQPSDAFDAGVDSGIDAGNDTGNDVPMARDASDVLPPRDTPTTPDVYDAGNGTDAYDAGNGTDAYDAYDAYDAGNGPDVYDAGNAPDVYDSGNPIDTGVPCGSSGESCCPDVPSCANGLECISGSCRPCGGYTEACCAMSFPQCFSPYTCTGGACVLPSAMCGMQGQPCCVSGDGAPPCAPGLTCGGTGTCDMSPVMCPGGMPRCNGACCSPGATCVGSPQHCCSSAGGPCGFPSDCCNPMAMCRFNMCSM